MTNYEYYQNKINTLLDNNDDIALQNNQLVPCSMTNCHECQFDTTNCLKDAYKWVSSEYKDTRYENTKEAMEVDWNKVPIDTPILVKMNTDNDWTRRYFAKYENGKIYTFFNGETSWTNNYNVLVRWNCAKLANPEDFKYIQRESTMSKEELMNQLCEKYKDSCQKSASKEMFDAVDKFWNSNIQADKKQKIANMVMGLLKME